MKFGVVGLGRMGGNLAVQAVGKGHSVVGFTRDASKYGDLKAAGVELTESYDQLVEGLDTPKVVFTFVPHGEPTSEVADAVASRLSRGDILIDGGNSHWLDSQARGTSFAGSGIRFLDMGTSGGVAGAESGACFMVGGDREAFEVIHPLLDDLAVDREGVVYVGPSGSGHFVKLVHNAIEFGMIQSIAEGVELTQRSDYKLDLPAIFNNWNHGSVIRSWLVELMGQQLANEEAPASLSSYVEDTGEVKWMVAWAQENDIPTPVVAQSQQALMQYRDLDWSAAKAVALLRNGFGEHPVHRKDNGSGGRS